LACFLKVRDLSRVTPRSLTESDRGTIEPTTLTWEILDEVLFRWWVPKIIASYLVGLKARQLRENHWDRSASANSSVWRSAVADDWEIEMWTLSFVCILMLVSTPVRGERSVGEILWWHEEGLGQSLEEPQMQILWLDEELPSLTYCERFVRKEVIHCRAAPEIPKVEWRWFKRIEWSIVSEAALRSRETRFVDLWALAEW